MSVKHDCIMASSDDIIQEVVRSTEDMVGAHCVALYTYGSIVKGAVDEWSDIDVLLVRDAAEEGLQRCRKWMGYLYERYKCVVDPMVLRELSLVTGTDASIASFAWALKTKAVLLLGMDVRERVPWPSVRALQVSAADIAVLSMRRLYMMPQDMNVPPEVPEYRPGMSGTCPAGSWIWQLVAAAYQLCRAIMVLSQGRLYAPKDALVKAVEQTGDAALVSALAAAKKVRGSLPRWDDSAKGCDSTDMLGAAIPVLYRRLLEEIRCGGLRDIPSISSR